MFCYIRIHARKLHLRIAHTLPVKKETQKTFIG